MSKEILFLCTGNTCRSPMAEALLQAALPADGEWMAASAGLFARPGRKASEHARDAMRRRGLTLEDHRSRQATTEMLQNAEKVFCMTEGHQECARQLAPGADIQVLGPAIGMPEDVRDPFGGSALAYELCAKQLEEMIQLLSARLQEGND